MKKLKIFISNNRVWVIIGTIIFLLIVAAIYGMSKLDSFYRTMTLATMPIHILVAFASAAAFVTMYMLFLRGGFSQMKKGKVKSDDIKVSFNEVIGLEGAKKALEVVQLIRDRKQLQRSAEK